MYDCIDKDRNDNCFVGTSSITVAYSHRSLSLHLYGRQELNTLNLYIIS
jgi:hypothetical protein